MFKIPLLIILIALISVGCKTDYTTQGAVKIEKEGEQFKLLRNGSPFFVKGAAGHANLKLLAGIGGNTIRTYDTLKLGQILDSAHANNLAVIVGIELPKSTQQWFYHNKDSIASFDKRLQIFINKHKNHPAVLLWCLGNEPIFYDFFNFSFATAYNQFYKNIKDWDKNHPVATALANVSERAVINSSLKLDGPDLFLINTFGRLHELEDDLANVSAWYKGPYIVGEYGVDGPWETEAAPWGAALEKSSANKAIRLKDNYQNSLPLNSPRCLGALAFYWGQRQEVTHTWFNFFNQKGHYNQMIYTLADLWKKPLLRNKPPSLSKLSIAGLSNPEKLLFEPGDTLPIKVTATDPEGDSLVWHWSLKPEDWFFEKWQAPASLENSFFKSKNQLYVIAPKYSGPFRLFAEVEDGNNNFATINLPFYVVSKN